jgi:hypothetical protein
VCGVSALQLQKFAQRASSPVKQHRICYACALLWPCHALPKAVGIFKPIAACRLHSCRHITGCQYAATLAGGSHNLGTSAAQLWGAHASTAQLSSSCQAAPTTPRPGEEPNAFQQYANTVQQHCQHVEGLHFCNSCMTCMCERTYAVQQPPCGCD